MTYTFKLARRLAVSRTLGMLPALILFAACSGGDTTAPDTSPAQAAVSINPSIVTLETNQLIRFRATGTNSAGDSVAAPVLWSSTGGTILPDGRFSAAATGTFMVIGRLTDRPGEPVDTSTVDVVRRQPTLKAIHVLPATVTLTTGMSQSFFAKGTLANGQTVAVGVLWRAEGGSIDAGGNYVAGDSAGTYRVIATNTSLTISDTAVVTISAPAPPPPPATPPPPALETVILSPASATLAPSATRQFAAYGRTTGGDSVAVNVVFTATGGTVTPGGLFTAGQSAGNFRVVATSGELADTSTVTVTVPLGSGPASGTPFGPFDLFKSASAPAVSGFTGTVSWASPESIVQRLASMRTARVRGILKMTGESHDDPDGTDAYRTNFKFDLAKWKAAMVRYDTPVIKAAIEAAVADGTLLGYSMIDEPNHTTWGGVITKATIDTMSRFSKGLFPTLPTGLAVPYYWRATERYQVTDFIVAQTWKPTMTPEEWRTAAVAAAKLNGVALVASINIMAGPQLAGCELRPNGTTCLMTPTEIRNWGVTLGTDPYACGMMMWRYDADLWLRSEYLAAFRDVAAALAKTTTRSCRRG
jgi:hypothetical protein